MSSADGSETGSPPQREQSTALGFAIASLVVIAFALLVRDEAGAVLFGLGTLLGLVGLGRGLYEASKPECYRSVGLAILISMLTGVGGVLLLIALIDFLGGYFPSP